MSDYKEFLIWTIVIPVLMIGMCVWQEARSLQRQVGEERYRVRLAEDIPALEDILARNPETVIHFSDDGVEMPVQEALQSARSAQQHMALVETLRWYSMGIPALGVGASLSVLASALMGVWGVRNVRQAGMRSRRELVQQFSLWQRRLSVVLCVLAGGFCCAVVCVVGFEICHYVITHMHAQLDVGSLVRAALMLIPIVIAGIYIPFKIVSTWRKIFVRDTTCLVGIKTTPETYPALWDFVREVSQRTGAQPPDSVVLNVDAEFFVTACDVELVLTQETCSGNTLCLGLPYLVYLSREELASVVAHELGHFMGEDLEYSQRFLPLYGRAWQQLDLLTGDEDDLLFTSRVALEPARMLAAYFLDSLKLCVLFWSRQREFAADAVSAAVCGPHTAASTLLRVMALQDRLEEALYRWRESPDPEEPSEIDTLQDAQKDDEAVDKVVEEENQEERSEDSSANETESNATSPIVQPLVQAFNGPEGLLAFIRNVVQTQGIPDPREALEKAVLNQFDSHPLTGQRLEAWGVVPDDTLVAYAIRHEESDILQIWGVTQRDAA